MASDISSGLAYSSVGTYEVKLVGGPESCLPSAMRIVDEEVPEVLAEHGLTRAEWTGFVQGMNRHFRQTTQGNRGDWSKLACFSYVFFLTLISFFCCIIFSPSVVAGVAGNIGFFGLTLLIPGALPYYWWRQEYHDDIHYRLMAYTGALFVRYRMTARWMQRPHGRKCSRSGIWIILNDNGNMPLCTNLGANWIKLGATGLGPHEGCGSPSSIVGNGDPVDTSCHSSLPKAAPSLSV